MLPWILAGAAIAGGYALLWIGHTTDAAALLVAGYCVGIPIAIMRSGRAAAGPARPGRAAIEEAPTPWLAASVVGAAVLALYVMTLSPTTAMWDASEYMAVVPILGLPHPPGNPLFVLMAHVWAKLPLAPNFAMRLNLFAAVASALTAVLWFLVAHDAIARMIKERWARIAGATVAAILGATAFTVWNQSVVNEKVYTVSLLQTVLSTWLALRWARNPADERGGRLLLMSIYLCGLGYAIHPAGFFALAPIGAAILVAGPRIPAAGRMKRLSRLAAFGAVLIVAGMTPFAYEPIRSSHDPALNEGEPTACDGKIAASCIFSSETYTRLRSNISREQFGKPPLLDRQAPIEAQVGMWWQYWNWQWFRDARGTSANTQLFIAVLAVVLAGAGARAQWRSDRAGFWVTAALATAVTPVLVYYLNFKYGFGQFLELGTAIEREVRHRDYFYIWSFSTLGMWMGLGLVAAWCASATTFARGRLLHASPILAAAFVPLVLNARDASRSGQSFTREWARDALASAPPGAVLITGGDNDTFPLWYAQFAEGYRRDVTVIVSSLLGTDWAAWQLARRIPPVFEPESADDPWRDAPRPVNSAVLRGSRAELDKIPPAIELPGANLFAHGAIQARVGPGLVTRDQLLLLQMIRDTFPDRPFVFTHAGFPASVGLGDHLARTGLLWRLLPEPVSKRTGLIATNQGPVDLAFSLEAWKRYRGVGQLAREGDWVDDASLSMPIQYVMLGSALIEALESQGRKADAGAVRAGVDSVYRAARLNRLEGN